MIIVFFYFDEPKHMSSPSDSTWTSTNGIHSLNNILCSLIPQWPNGPHSYQLEATAHILDRCKQLVVAACGEGKTALAYLHLLVIQELLQKPHLPRYSPNTDISPPCICLDIVEDNYERFFNSCLSIFFLPILHADLLPFEPRHFGLLNREDSGGVSS